MTWQVMDIEMHTVKYECGTVKHDSTLPCTQKKTVIVFGNWDLCIIWKLNKTLSNDVWFVRIKLMCENNVKLESEGLSKSKCWEDHL